MRHLKLFENYENETLSLKERLADYLYEADYDSEEIKNTLEILDSLKDDLSDLERWDQILLLRLVDDDDLYDEINKIDTGNNYYKNIFEKNLLTYNIQDMHNEIKLIKVADKIYTLVIKDMQLRAMLFLRFQEYYESSSDEFQGKKFLWDRYIQWYKENGKNKEVFTYGSDWTGFNLPSQTIENCLSDIDDFNKYDETMVSVMKTIRKQEKGNFYLMGVEEIDGDVLEHECAHGFYYTDVDYRNKMNNLINLLPSDKREGLSKLITDMGYSESVVSDEIQAYMSTGLIDKMNHLKLDKFTKGFEKVFNDFRKIHQSDPFEIKIEY